MQALRAKRAVWSDAARLSAIAAVYLGASKLGLSLASIHPSATPVWPSTGIAIAAILLFGPPVAPGIFLGAFLTNLTTAGTAWTSVGIATGNTLEAVVAAALVRRYANGRRAFGAPADIFKFAGLAAVASTAVSATIGVTSLALGGFAPWSNYGPIWLTWWLGDAGGAVAVTPLIVLWADGGPFSRTREAIIERVAFLCALAAVGGIVFGGWFPFTYITVPLLVWAAFRFERRETIAAVILLALVAIWGTIHGHGPFVRATPNQSLLFLQAFIGFMVIMALPLAAMVAAHETAGAAGRRSEAAQRLLVQTGTMLGASLDPEQTLDAVAHLVVLAFADWCSVDLVEEDGGVRRLVTIHKQPALRAPAAEPEGRSASDRQAPERVREVIRSGRSELHPRLPDDAATLIGLETDPDLPAIESGLGSRSAMIVPLRARGRVLGAMTLVSDRGSRPYDDADLALAEELAHRAAVAADNARLHHAERSAHATAELAVQRVQRLQAVTAALSEALTHAEVGDVILEEGVRALSARAAVVYERREDDDTLEMIRSTGYPQEIGGQWARTPISAATPSADAARRRTAMYFESRAAVLERYPSLEDKINPHGGRRAFVPLVVRGRAIGALVFIFAEPKSFQEEERVFIQALAHQCAQALERSRLYERERRVAEVLQRAFLPLELPAVPGLTIAAAYIPGAGESEVGGDWYDAFTLPDGRIALGVGDVVGHGLHAAVVMGQMRQSVRAAALEMTDPASVLATANRVLTHGHGTEMMATAVLGILDPATMVFTYACSGHPAPIVCGEGGATKLPRGGLPLGIALSIAPETHTVELAPGALLLLYTDGIVELTRNIDEGERMLLAAVEAERRQPAADSAQAIVQRVLTGRAAADDIALMSVAVADAPFDRFAITVPAEPASLRPVRQTLARLAASAGLAHDRVSRLQVAVGEAMNNAVEHAYGSGQGVIDVRGWRDGETVYVEVEDHGLWRPERIEGRGHGLRLMRLFVDAVEVESGHGGTIVKFAVSIARRASEPAVGPATEDLRASSAAHPPVSMDRQAPPAGGGMQELPSQFKPALVGGVPVLDVEGDLDLANEHLLLDALERAARHDRRRVVVSLSRVAYIDSRGVHALLRFGARLATNRQRLLFVAARESMARQILVGMGLGAAHRIFDTVEQAIAEPDGPPSPPETADPPRGGTAKHNAT